MTKFVRCSSQYLFVLCVTIFLACNATKTQENGESCQFVGTVKDMSDLDGCQFLILTEKGEKLLPTRVPEEFLLKDGQQIKFGFRETEAMASVCMAEDKIVEITCIELMKAGENETRECLNIENPVEISWMKKAIEDLQPNQVVKYRYRTNSWAYLFKGKKTYLYDCQGTLICESMDAPPVKCMSKIGSNKVGVVIWQGEGVND